MEKKTLTPSQLRLFSIEEELIDLGARKQFAQELSFPSGNADGIGRMLRETIDVMPRIPVYAGTLFRAVTNPESTSSIISRVISEDPSLAAQILKNVNSPYYGFPNKVVDLQHAITLLGISQIHSLILYHGMRTTLPNTRSFVNLQSQSVLLSHVAGAVAELVDHATTPLFSTLGLLSNIGKGVVFFAQHKHPEIEEAVPLLDHFKIGSMLLIRWGLPELIHETIRLMGKAKYIPPSEIPEPYRHNVSILTLAVAVLDRRSIGETDASSCLEEYMHQAGFGALSLEDLGDGHVLPLLQRKKGVLPHVVRNFLDRSPQTAVRISKAGIGSVEKRLLERRSSREEDAGSPPDPPATPARPHEHAPWSWVAGLRTWIRRYFRST